MRKILAALGAAALCLALAGCPGSSGGHHRPPPSIIIHKP